MDKLRPGFVPGFFIILRIYFLIYTIFPVVSTIGFFIYLHFMEIWKSARDYNPDHWGNQNGYNMKGAFIRVRLDDGREINTRWDSRGWSVERLKPHLKVAQWRVPVIIA